MGMRAGPTSPVRPPLVPPSLARPALEDILKRSVTITTLPQVALRVMEVARDPHSGARELKAVVEGDPALSARLLRRVNSAAFGLTTPVTNLHQAISYVGLNQIRNLALTISVSEVFRHEARCGPYTRSGLWRHLVSVGICARRIAARCRFADFDDAFLAGLLHDIGIILEDQHAHETFACVMGGLVPGRELIVSEREQMDCDHVALGVAVAGQWRFAESIRTVIAHHHAAHACTGPGAHLARCVEAANIICSLRGITSVGMNLVRANVETFRALGFHREDVIVLAADLDREIDRNRHLFEV